MLGGEAGEEVLLGCTSTASWNTRDFALDRRFHELGALTTAKVFCHSHRHILHLIRPAALTVILSTLRHRWSSSPSSRVLVPNSTAMLSSRSHPTW
jgi:hypothetical protein